MLTLRLLILAMFIISPRAWADLEDFLTGPTQPPTQAQILDQLSTTQREISFLEKELEDKRKQVVHLSKDDAAEMEADIADLEQRLERARLSFVALTSNVEIPLAENPKAKTEKRDLLQEAQQLIEPLFDAIKRVSEKPRRIEALRSRDFYLRDRLDHVNKAIAGLNKSLQNKAYSTFEKEIETSKQSLEHERDELTIRAAAIERKLKEENADRRTVMQVITQQINEFAGTQGKNLLIAVLVFICAVWLMLSFKRVLLRSRFINRKLRGLHKPFAALYGLLAGVIGIFASVFALHFLNDWFLASLLMLTLFAGAWAIKSVLHLFVHETKVALNLGTVKEGERVIWNGLPWLVQHLGFRSILLNEALQGGTIALPASALNAMFSRETVEGEPWFPTRVGDFVLMDDGVYGQVEVQTPETVVLNTGTTRKHYSTSTFISKNPENFSYGFEVKTEFLYRQTQSLPNQKVLSDFRTRLNQIIGDKLIQRYPVEAERPQRLEIQITPSGPQSVRAWLAVSCPGRLASQRDQIRRQLHADLIGAFADWAQA